MNLRVDEVNKIYGQYFIDFMARLTFGRKGLKSAQKNNKYAKIEMIPDNETPDDPIFINDLCC